MNQQTKPWGAIIVMIALFAMIAFVTNLCSPMANIIKAQALRRTVCRFIISSRSR